MTDWKPIVLWQALLPRFLRPRTIYGQDINTVYVMRRRGPSGQWAYRLQTPEETAEEMKDSAW